MSAAVVTVVSGRHDHLLRQQRLLARTHPDVPRVVVSLGDPEIGAVLAGTPPTRLVDLPGDTGQGLPLAAGRNAGVAAAWEDPSTTTVVCLDVDCLAGPDLVERYVAACAPATGAGSVGPPVLACGPATYLAVDALPPLPALPSTDLLTSVRDPHPARPDPAPGTVVTDDRFSLFWSLSFAVGREVWARLGGFDEAFVGYGAEDTDLAHRAAELGVHLAWVGGADAWHQWHPAADPPVHHLEALVRNGGLFAQRHGWWPMAGWFDGLADLGLVRWTGSAWVRSDP